MKSFIHPVIGQEAVVPRYGLGRVVGFVDRVPDRGIEIRPYGTRYVMKFEPEDVRLVRINYTKEKLT